jgi:hypothetical protein
MQEARPDPEHLHYQLRYPELVRKFTMDAFVSSRMEDYSKHPTDAALHRARHFAVNRDFGTDEFEGALHHLAGLNEEQQWNFLKELPTYQLRSLIEHVEERQEGVPLPLLRKIREVMEARTGADAPHPDPKLGIIARGSQGEYIELARVHPLGIFLTVCLYGLGIWLIILVIKVQSMAVIQASGWHSFPDLLIH